MRQTKRDAYQGNEAYAFVSYSHRDAKDVYPAIAKIMDYAYNVWYDEGIKAGEDWANTIGVKLKNSNLMILFLSRRYLKSQNCMREVAFALEHNIPILTVCLEKARLPESLQRDLQVSQMVNLAKIKSYNAFVQTISSALNNAGIPGSENTSSTKDCKVKIRRRQIRKTILLGVVLCLIVGCICNRVLFGYVPSVIGLEQEEARQRIEEADYKSTISVDYSEKVEYGYICQQNVTGKTLCFRTVQLTQSLGPNSNLADVPQAEGFQISDGVANMIDAGFRKLIIEPKKTKECAVTYVAHQSIPAGLRVSTENKITLQVAVDGSDIVLTYDGRRITIPADKKSLITTDEKGNLVVNTINTFTLDVKDDSEYWINNAKTLFLNMETISLTKLEEVDQTGTYRGTVHVSFEIFSKKESPAWSLISGTLGQKDGIIPAKLTIDPMIMEMEPFDQKAYESFVYTCDKTGNGIKEYEEPVCMYLAHSITLTQESKSTELLKALTKFADLFSDRLPVIDGDQLYVDYSVVILSDGTADLTFYGDSVWGMKGEVQQQ